MVLSCVDLDNAWIEEMAYSELLKKINNIFGKSIKSVFYMSYTLSAHTFKFETWIIEEEFILMMTLLVYYKHQCL